jgi:hypothetical protein
MARDTLEVRIAHLEGAFEQIDRRLGNVETALAGLRTDVHAMSSRLDQKIDTAFRWVIGVVLVNWITVMLAIFARR